MTNQPLNSTAMPIKLIEFYDITLTVVEYEGTQYVLLRPIVEMLGLSWRHSRKTILTDENVSLFGVRQLNVTPLDTYIGSFDDENSYGTDEIKPKNLPVYILYEQVYLYLARISTANVRAKGNETGADRLRRLQQEWGRVLYRYENGETVQKQQQTQEKSLTTLMNNRSKAQGQEKLRLTYLINRELDKMGAPKLEDPQGDLF